MKKSKEYNKNRQFAKRKDDDDDDNLNSNEDDLSDNNNTSSSSSTTSSSESEQAEEVQEEIPLRLKHVLLEKFQQSDNSNNMKRRNNNHNHAKGITNPGRVVKTKNITTISTKNHGGLGDSSITSNNMLKDQVPTIAQHKQVDHRQVIERTSIPTPTSVHDRNKRDNKSVNRCQTKTNKSTTNHHAEEDNNEDRTLQWSRPVIYRDSIAYKVLQKLNKTDTFHKLIEDYPNDILPSSTTVCKSDDQDTLLLKDSNVVEPISVISSCNVLENGSELVQDDPSKNATTGCVSLGEQANSRTGNLKNGETTSESDEQQQHDLNCNSLDEHPQRYSLIHPTNISFWPTVFPQPKKQSKWNSKSNQNPQQQVHRLVRVVDGPHVGKLGIIIKVIDGLFSVIRNDTFDYCITVNNAHLRPASFYVPPTGTNGIESSKRPKVVLSTTHQNKKMMKQSNALAIEPFSHLKRKTDPAVPFTMVGRTGGVASSSSITDTFSPTTGGNSTSSTSPKRRRQLSLPMVCAGREFFDDDD